MPWLFRTVGKCFSNYLVPMPRLLGRSSHSFTSNAWLQLEDMHIASALRYRNVNTIAQTTWRYHTYPMPDKLSNEQNWVSEWIVVGACCWDGQHEDHGWPTSATIKRGKRSCWRETVQKGYFCTIVSSVYALFCRETTFFYFFNWRRAYEGNTEFLYYCSTVYALFCRAAHFFNWRRMYVGSCVCRIKGCTEAEIIQLGYYPAVAEMGMHSRFLINSCLVNLTFLEQWDVPLPRIFQLGHWEVDLRLKLTDVTACTTLVCIFVVTLLPILANKW